MGALASRSNALGLSPCWQYRPARARAAQALVDQAQGDRGGQGLGGAGPLRQEQKVAYRLCGTPAALAIPRALLPSSNDDRTASPRPVPRRQPFVHECLAHGNQREAARHIARCEPAERPALFIAAGYAT